jgi:hypothetical protein
VAIAQHVLMVQPVLPPQIASAVCAQVANALPLLVTMLSRMEKNQI